MMKKSMGNSPQYLMGLAHQQHFLLKEIIDVCNRLKYQLFANILCASVIEFINKMKNLMKYPLKMVKKITGYGVAYTGLGHIGYYKLEMTFNKKT